MRIDLVKIEAQIRRLQELQRIASDPELLALLDTVMVKNDANTVKPPRMTYVPQQLVDGEKRGSIIHAVREFALKETSSFDAYQIADKMKESGFKFSSDNPSLSVMDALRILIKKGHFRVLEKGMAGRPSKFERIPPTEQKENTIEQ